MKTSNFISTGLLSLAVILNAAVARATLFKVDLSPPGTDNTVGLSPLNEVPPVTNSAGSGDAIVSGISFDTDTGTLSLSIGFGSAFGITNLTGAVTAAGIHGPAQTNVAAPVLIDLTGFIVPAVNPADGGSITGTVTLTTNEIFQLFAGLLYLDLDTATNPAGEIRGQLVITNSPPVLECPASTNLQCTGEANLVNLSAGVADADGDELTVVWTVNGAPIQTNTVPGGTSTNLTAVNFAACTKWARIWWPFRFPTGWAAR